MEERRAEHQEASRAPEQPAVALLAPEQVALPRRAFPFTTQRRPVFACRMADAHRCVVDGREAGGRGPPAPFLVFRNAAAESADRVEYGAADEQVAGTGKSALLDVLLHLEGE